MANNSFSINLDLDKQKVEDGLKQLGQTIDKNITDKKLSIQLDQQKLNEQLKAVESKLKSIETKKIKMDIDDKVVDDQIKNLKSKIESIETSKIKAGFDSESAAKEVNSLQKDLEKLLSKKTKIGLNISDAESEIGILSNMMSDIEDQKAKIQVDVDDSDVRDLQESIDNIDDKSVKVSADADASEVENFNEKLDELPADKVVKVSLEGTMTEAVAKAEGLSSLGNSLKELSENGVEYASAMKKIQTQTQLTGLELEKFKLASENAYKNGVGENIAETTEKMLEARKALGASASIKEVQDFATQAEAVAKSTGKDYNEITAAATSSIKNYGISSTEALSSIASALTNVGESQDVLGTMQEFSQDSRDAGYSAQEFGRLLENSFANGADNINKFADGIQEMGIRLAAGDTKKALGEINSPIAKSIASMSELAKKGEMTQKEFMERSAEMIQNSNVSDVVKKNIATAIAGSKAEDLGSNFWGNFVKSPLDEKALNEKSEKILNGMTKSIAPKDVFSEFTKSASLELAKISSSVAPMMKSIGGAMTTVGQIAPGLKLLQEFDLKKSISGMKDFASGVVNGAKQLLGVLVPATTSATAAQTGLNAAQSANPMGAIILAVVALGAAFYILYQKSEAFRNFIDQIGAVAKDAFNGIIEAVSPLKDTLVAYGELILKYITAPFKLLWGVIQGVMEHFKSTSDSAETIGTKIAGLKPIFEKIGKVATDVFRAIGTIIDWLVENGIKIAVGAITSLIDIFISIGKVVSDVVSPIFDFFWTNILKPIVNGIGDFVAGVGNAIDSIGGFSAKNAEKAAEESKKSLDMFKKNREEMDKLASNSFGADTWDDATKTKVKERAQSLKDSMMASASIIQDPKEKQKQIDYVNNLYNTIFKNINGIKKKNADATAPTPIDPAKAAEIKKAQNDQLRADEIYNARLIDSEKDRKIKIIEINEKYDLIGLTLEKKSQADKDKVIKKAAQDRNIVIEEYRKKDYEAAVASAKENSKSIVDQTQLVVDDLKSQLDAGDTGVLAEYVTNSWKKLNLDHAAQLQDYLDKDKEYIEKNNSISLLVSTGQITQEEGLKQLQEFGDKRLDVLKLTNIGLMNLIKKQSKDEKELKKTLGEVDAQVQLQEKLKQAKTVAEYEKTEKILNLQKTMDAEVKAAKGNNIVILRAKMNFWKESAKVEKDYMDSTATYSTKLFKNLATVFGGIFKNLKIGNNSDSINQAKTDLKTVEDALKSLDAQRLEGSINETEYEIKQQELLAQKQDAMDRAGQSYLNFGSIVQSVNDAIVESMKAMVESTMAENTKLYEQMAENQISIEELRKKGNERTTEESAELLRLIDEQESKKQELFGNTALVMSSVFVESVASQKSALKSLVMAILSAMKAMIPSFIAMIWGVELGTKGFPAGNISAMLLTGLLYGLVSAAEGIVGQLDFAKGGENPYGGFGQGLHKKQKNVLLRVAETGKSEYVFNPFVTAASDIKELDMINKMRISPKEFYARQLGSTNTNIDVSLLYNELVNIKKTLQTTKVIDQKTVVQNHLKVTAEVKSESLRKY